MVQRELVELPRSGDREAFSALASSVVDRLYATGIQFVVTGVTPLGADGA